MNFTFQYLINFTFIPFLQGKKEVFETEVIEQLKNENIYQYQENVDLPESLWDQFWNWIGKQLNKIFDALFGIGKPGWWGTFVDFLPYLVIGLVIALLIYLFFKNNPLRKDVKINTKTNEVLLNNLNEEERKLAIDKLIEKAKNKNDYQLLVRYQYIKTLMQLDHYKLIRFKSDKTNSEYYKELKNLNFLDDFKTLTYYYENAWYGNFKVTHFAYQDYLNALNTITTQLNQQNG